MCWFRWPVDMRDDGTMRGGRTTPVEDLIAIEAQDKRGIWHHLIQKEGKAHADGTVLLMYDGPAAVVFDRRQRPQLSLQHRLPTYTAVAQ